MSLKDALDEYENPVVVKEEADDRHSDEDIFGMDDATNDEDACDDDEEEELVWEGAVVDGSQDDSDMYDPRTETHAERYQWQAKVVKKKPKYVPRLWNMTYSHEQRVKMGYFAAKWGIKAMKIKFKGVKESTGRDMRTFVQKLVREGKLSLDIPIEKQVIPPKTRRGVPVLPIAISHSNNDAHFSGQTADPGSSDQSTADEDDDNRKSPVFPFSPSYICGPNNGKNSPDKGCTETTTSASQNITPSRSTAALDFESRVAIGFLAFLHGTMIAMKKHDVSESVVKECRNVVVKLVQSGQLSLDVPLEEQDIPNDPDKPSKSITSRASNRSRPLKQAVVRQFNASRTLSTAPVSSSRMTTRQSVSQDRACEAPVTPSSLHRAVIDDRGQRGRKDISLATDLAFLRWTNRRTSLGFRSDQAFAMHLMDVHDAFCADQCNGGGRHEQYQNGTEINE